MSLCPCIHPDVDPEDDNETCACSHVLDEHAEDGHCQVEMDPWEDEAP